MDYLAAAVPPRVGDVLRLLGNAEAMSLAATELKRRASNVNLQAVQYARCIKTRTERMLEVLREVNRAAELASPSGGNHVETFQRRWPGWREDLLGCTADVAAVVDHLERHFPLATRLLPDTAAEGFLHDLNRELDRDRAERVQRLLRAAGPNGPPDAA